MLSLGDLVESGNLMSLKPAKVQSPRSMHARRGTVVRIRLCLEKDAVCGLKKIMRWTKTGRWDYGNTKLFVWK